QEVAPDPVQVASIPAPSAAPHPQAVTSSPQAVPAPRALPQEAAAPAPKPDVPMDPTMKKLVGMLVQKGVITQDAANQLLQKEPVRQGEIRVPYVPEVVKNEIKDEIKDEVLAQAHGERWGDPDALPGWLSRISFNGDLRVRYQHNGYPSGNVIPSVYNPTGIVLIPNTTETHDYLLLAAHFGINAKVSDYTKAAIRLTTGNTANPDSINQTLGGGSGSYYAPNAPVGTNGNFNKYSVVMDRAYIQSDPYSWLSLSAGKIPNPWLSTDLVWDYDVNFDGLAGTLKPQFNDDWMGFLTTGIFPVQDLERSVTQYANSKWLVGSQVGGQWTSPNQSTIKFGVALYDFVNIQGQENTAANPDIFDKTAASTMQKGNSLMYVTPPGNNWGTGGAALPALYGIASKFRELDFTGKMDLATFDPTHVMLQADYVKNLAFDASQILERSGLTYPYAKTTAYHLNLIVGMPEIKEIGDWQAKVAYKYIGSDAVLDALNDQDFHLGGTNAKGFIIGGQYGIDRNTWVKVRWLSSDQVSGPPLAIDVLQCDLNTRF
ncbi:MAG TPA: putative porin, partial [Burkholderiales bacterium]|nr:putative porin [Burkholderiales bacterium]